MRMFRSALGKVAWVGRTASMVFGLALVMALVLGVASMAFGANGQNFILGKLNNAATKVTGLVGNVDGAAALRVTNPNAGTNDTALDLRVQTGEAPMAVNSSERVANLNAATAGRADSAASADTATLATHAENAENAGGLECAGCVGESDLDGSAATQAELEALGTNDGAANQASDPVNYTKVKDIPADITNRNADTLDYLNSTQLMRSSTYRLMERGTGAAGTFTDLTVNCNPGDKVLSGGYDGVDFNPTTVNASVPLATGNGWFVSYQSGSLADNVDAFALCVDM